MKKFIVGFFAIIGVLFALVVGGLIVLGANAGASKEKQLPQRMVLALNLDDGLTEIPSDHNIVSSLTKKPGLTLGQIIQTLDMARQDNRVVGLAVRLKQGDFGLASTQELRQALLRFNKPTYVYTDTLGDKPAMSEYWLASAFNHIWMQPLGELAISGFNVEVPFAKTLLDNIGVTAELYHEGKYKSFPESVMRNTISADNKFMTQDLLNNLQSQFEKDISQSRKIKTTSIQQATRQSPLTAQMALDMKLIDSVGYADEFDAYLEQNTKGAAPVPFDTYQVHGPRPVPGEKIAYIRVMGALTTATTEEAAFNDNVVSAESIVAAVQDATDDRSIKAIIVRVNSPGGTPLASDMIRRSLELAKIQKPVIISMSDTAASGGYWMSVDASAIVAQPTTLTGSIGVFGGKFTLQGLWKKLGVTWETVATDNADTTLWSSSKPYDAQARAKVNASLKRTYDTFIQTVAKGRKMDKDAVQTIAQGRVWTGQQALNNGLIDALGGVDTAIAKAKKMADIAPQRAVNLVAFPKPKNPLEQFLSLLQQGLPFRMMGSEMSTWFQKSLHAGLEQSLMHLSTPQIQ